MAPAEGGLSVPLVPTAPTSSTTNAPAPSIQIAETPLVVELETPLVQATQTALAASSSTPSLLDDDLSTASNSGGVVLNQSLNSAATTLDVKTKSTASNSIIVSWNELGAESYTVQYRLQDSGSQWTSKVVKGKTNLSISVKQNLDYEVRVIPQGMAGKTETVTNVRALSKLTAKVVNRTDNSISIQISNNATGWIGYVLGIKTQSEKTYTYYDVYQGNTGYSGALSYSFQGNTLTIKGLSSNTTYNFQIAQTDGVVYNTWGSAISPYTSLNAATTGQKVTKIVVNTLEDLVNNDRYTSLREAIQKATDGAVITFANNLKGKSIHLNSSITISKNITIDASSLYDTKYDEPGLTFVMERNSTYGLVINGATNVTIKGINFISGYYVTGNGIRCVGRSNSVFNIQNCYFGDLETACYFEGSYKSAITNFHNCTFDMTDYGLENVSTGRMNVTDCYFWDCYEMSISNGSNSSLYVSNTRFEDNYGVCHNEGSAEFDRCSFLYNSGYVIFNTGNAVMYNCLAVHNDLDNDDWACFWNYSQGSLDIYNMTSAHNSKTFRNDGSNYALSVRDSVCSKKNYGSGKLDMAYCITFTDSGLDESYRPTASSPCVDASSSGSIYWSEKDLAGNIRCMGNGVDVGCYEYLPVESRSTASGKATIYWENSGASSYTVQYREEGTQKWTTKTVKNKTELALSVKNNVIYEVLVTPENASNSYNQVIWAGALAKLGVKTQTKTRNSVTFVISNMAPAERYFEIGIKKQNATNYTYYTFYQGNSGKLGTLSYSFYGNTLTISGLSSNTKYDFQFSQYIDFSTTVLEMPASAISTPTKVSITTNK